MKIRSITYFINPQWPVDDIAIQKAGEFISEARLTFESAEYEVQTVRLATVPYTQLVPGFVASEVIALAHELEGKAKELGYEYISIGPAFPGKLTSYELIPEVLASTEVTFLSGMMTTTEGSVSIPAVCACAEVIYRAASIAPDGFANLRFAALANVPPGSPFFPAAYHNGDSPSFAIATEGADLAVDAFSQAQSLEAGRVKLIDLIEQNASRITAISQGLEARFGVYFGGIDFSLAPFPEDTKSIGTAFESLGLPALGLHGTLAAAAILADTLDRARFQRAGFNGLFMPVLEDALLSQRADEGTLTVKDLLLYSAVCGTGLDTVPLPGDVSIDQLASILLDIASLGVRLGKPLTARLMPIPGKSAGDRTNFDFVYFSNSRVMDLNAGSLTRLLSGDEEINLSVRRR
jgi:uncharacterized protein (UPF0210 family)